MLPIHTGRPTGRPGVFSSHANHEERHMTRMRRAERKYEFRIVDGVLYRTVELLEGRSYRHTCTLESFADVARYVDEHAAEGVTTTRLWDALEVVPCTQATVALEFLKDR